MCKRVAVFFFRRIRGCGRCFEVYLFLASWTGSIIMNVLFTVINSDMPPSILIHSVNHENNVVKGILFFSSLSHNSSPESPPHIHGLS